LTPATIERAVAHLRTADPVLDRLIGRVGPCRFSHSRSHSPYRALLYAVAHQQLHGAAAKAILGRFVALYQGRDFPSPEDVHATPDRTLRTVGFSRGKIRCIRDLTAKTLEGIVPERRVIQRLGDEAVIKRLTAVHGVGRWTVEMLLMSTLGRPDVLPVDDYGIRAGFRIAYGMKSMPKPSTVRRRGERWRPYRTIASWYLWRATELPK
jgi:DNA-3-methyladenine glycosylase II